VDKVVGDTITRRTGQAKPLGQKLGRCRRAQLQLATGGIKGAVLGREAMQALEQATTSPAWATVSAVAKKRVGRRAGFRYHAGIVDLATRIRQSTT